MCAVRGACTLGCRMADEGADGAAALSMCLEALVVLINPDVALNLALPR